MELPPVEFLRFLHLSAWDLLEQFLNVIIGVHGVEAWVVTLVWHTLGINKELLVVPGDVILGDRTPIHATGDTNQASGAWTLTPDNVKHLMGVISIDTCFLSQRKQWNKVVSRTDILVSVHQLSILSWLLETKLITGKAQHNKVGAVHLLD